MIYTEKNRLSNDLRARVPDLFSVVGGVIQDECSYPQPFGNAWVIVSAGNVLLRFVWDRGFAAVEYQQVGQHGGWRDVQDVIRERTGREVTAYSWEQWCDLLERNFDVLKNEPRAPSH